MLGKIEGGRRRGWQRMRWLDGITFSVDMGLSNSRSWRSTGRPCVLQPIGSQRVRHIWATNTHIHIDEHSPWPSSAFPTWGSTPRWIFQAVQSSTWRTEYNNRTQAGCYRKSLYVTHPDFSCGAFRVFPFLRVHFLTLPRYFYPIVILFFSFKDVFYMTFHLPSLCKATRSQSVVEN